MNALRALFLAIGGAVGVVYPFIAVILLGRGFDVVGVGVVTAISALAFTAAVPAWGHLADVVLGRPRALQLSALAAGLALGVTLLPVPPLVVAICFIAFAAAESAFAPLGDALAVNAVPDPRRDYAAVRLLTSLSFGVATIAAGFVYDSTGFAPVPILFALAAAIVIASAAFTPDVERADLRVLTADEPEAASNDLPEGSPADRPGSRAGQSGQTGQRRPRGPTWRLGSVGVAFRLAPRLPLALVAIGLAHVGILAGFTFLSIRLRDLGADPSAIALSAGVSAFAEVAAFLVMGALALRFGIRAVFVGSALLYAACFGSWVVLDSPALIIATRVATGFGFAGINVAAVLTVTALLPDRLQGTGQALYQTTAFGVAAVVANIGGGIIYGTAGYAATFTLAAIAAVASALVGLVAVPKGSGARAAAGGGGGGKASTSAP